MSRRCTEIFHITPALTHIQTSSISTCPSRMMLRLCAVVSWNCPNWIGYRRLMGDLEDSEKEDENEGGGDEAILLDSIKMDTGVEVPNTGTQDRPYSALRQRGRRNYHFSYFKKIRTYTIIATQAQHQMTWQ